MSHKDRHKWSQLGEHFYTNPIQVYWQSSYRWYAIIRFLYQMFFINLIPGIVDFLAAILFGVLSKSSNKFRCICSSTKGETGAFIFLNEGQNFRFQTKASLLVTKECPSIQTIHCWTATGWCNLRGKCVKCRSCVIWVCVLPCLKCESIELRWDTLLHSVLLLPTSVS